MKSIVEFADIIEFQAWASTGPATQSAIEEQLESALADEDKPQKERIAQNVLDEFQNHQKMLGTAYPFKTDG